MNSIKLDYIKPIINIKCIFIGNLGVGKSSIITRYTNDFFSPNNFSTIGVEYYFKNITIDDKLIKLQIWDLAGNTNFKSIIRSYYRNAEILFYVFDKNDRTSFDDFENWIDEFRDKLNEILLVIVGNKCDLNDSCVTSEEGIELANKYNALYYESSAKSDINIKDIFDISANLYYFKHFNTYKKPEESNTVQLRPIYNSRFSFFSKWCSLI